MADSWLEPRTRIPFVGIIAMVLIVAVVAIFIKTQLAPLFPAAKVTVEDGNTLTGHATSDSFYGMRKVDLERKELLHGSLNARREAVAFTVDVPHQMLSIDDAGHVEEVELGLDGERLRAAFEYDAQPTTVVVDGPGRSLVFSSERTAPIEVALSDIVVYQGSFTYQGNLHEVSFSPAGDEIVIDKATVALSEDGKTFTGTWTDGSKKHPITIDAEKQLLTIEDIY